MLPSLRDIARSVASWVLLLALSVDALAIVVEPIAVVVRGGPLRAGVATALAAVALSAGFALVAAVPVAIVHGLVRAVGRWRRPWRYAWPLVLVAVAWLVVPEIAPHKVIHARSLEAGQRILASLFAASLLVAAGVARVPRSALRVPLGAGLALAGLVAATRLPAILNDEPRDLLWLCTVLFLAAAFHPARTRLAKGSHERASRGVGRLVLLSVPLLFVAPLVARDWRTYASNGAMFAPRIARFARTLVDLDGDGFSAIAWGTDCADLDAARQPVVREKLDGIDHNCNGKLRPAEPTPSQRGLAPAAGEPDATPGAIDRVVLVTIDCFRNDAFTPEVTPNLVRLASRGLRFAKLYAAGARTSISLPFVLRGAVDAPTVAQLLGPARVTTTAIFGYRHSTLEGNVFEGFQTLKRPDVVDRRIRAPELTDLALADLRDPAHARAHFLWVHYFDAHGPRARRVLPADVRAFPPIAAEPDGDSALYLSELSYIDEQVGRLVDGLAEMDPAGRTLVVVTSDHGEGFGRHGVREHGVSAFEAIIHVPGFVVAPGIAPGVYPHVASQRDVAATILGAFGLVAAHPAIESFGRSWLRLRAAPDAPLHEFAVSYETTVPFESWGDAPMASIVDDHGKLSASYVDRLVRLYDLDRDPGEDHEIASERPDVASRYSDQLEIFRDIDAPPP